MATTSEVLASMFTENTGRHMLDSGDAYGRQWERNAGRDVNSFLEAPKAFWSYGPTIDTFHYLNDRLEYAPVMDRWLHIFAESDGRERDGWYSVITEFAAHASDTGETAGWNSYNDETLLSGVIQWTTFTRDDETYICLQIHGGADVRGGYTQGRVFKVSENWYYQVQNCSVYCPKCEASWEIYGLRDVVEPSGQTTDTLDPALHSGDDECPICHHEGLEVDAPVVC